MPGIYHKSGSHILTLTFDDFMSELRKNFLPSDWVETVRMSLLGMWMSRNTRFWDFAQDVHALNIVLRGTSSHMDNSMLRNQLEAGLEPALQAECSRGGLCAVTALKDWIEHVKKVDERLTFDRKRYREIFIEESAIRASKRPALGNSHLPNAPTANTSTYATTTSREKSFIRLSK